jgi:hypothetical protein
MRAYRLIFERQRTAMTIRDEKALLVLGTPDYALTGSAAHVQEERTEIGAFVRLGSRRRALTGY